MTTNRKIFTTCWWILIAAFIISLTPWYTAYCAHDDAWTCAKYRQIVQWDYSSCLKENNGKYDTGSEDLLRQALVRTYKASDYTLTQESDEAGEHCYALEGICRSGGTIHIVMDDAGNIVLTCDTAGHENAEY